MRRLTIVVFVVMMLGLGLAAGHSETVETKTARVTLLVRKRTAEGDNWDKAIVSFRPEEIYAGSTGPANDWDLLYGALNHNGDRDWFQVNCDNKGWSRIRDIGELHWSDEITVPVLPILACKSDQRCGRIHIPSPESAKNIHDEDVNPHIAKPIAGHMYVVHRYREKRPADPPGSGTQLDFYTLVRVEELKPNESCTITWKRIPAPKRHRGS